MVPIKTASQGRFFYKYPKGTIMSGYAKGKDGKTRTVKNPLEGSTGNIGLEDATFTTVGVVGNVSAGNLLTNGYLYANGAPISFGANYGDSNVVSLMASFGSNIVTTSGNVTAGYFLGDGSGITGMSTSQLTNDSGFITTSTANVVSVNGQSGAVTLAIPTATSNLTNDSGFITTATANVISVNGQTGAVTISAGSTTAANVSYTESNPADWPGVVANVQAGLDTLANLVANFETGSGFTFLGPFSNDSQAAAGGVALGQVYYNASGGLVVRQT